MMILSGVAYEDRAKGGVGCIIHKNVIKYLKKWECISGRIMKIELQIEGNSRLHLVIMYGPNDNDKAETKDKFWEEASEIVENCNGKIVVIGDLNGRVGIKDGRTSDVIGQYGETTRNNNGYRIIDFCVQNNLLVMNSFFKHKDVHKYTREVPSRGEKSIIDYVLINRNSRREIRDVRVIRGPEINSDHYLLKAKTTISCQRVGNNKNKVELRNNNSKETIKNYRLMIREVADKYTKKVEEMIGETRNKKYHNVEEAWETFRNTLISAARETCGTSKINRNKKQTAWWNDNVKREVKLKKEKWKIYLRTGNNTTYQDYKRQRDRVKEIVLEAKRETWEEFGRKMEADFHTNQKLFFKTLKNLRLGKKNEVIKQIKDEHEAILTEEEDIIERWRRYFENLLNKEITVDKNERTYNIEEIQQQREHIELQEVKNAIKRLKRGKAAGHDNITGEMLKNMGGKGVQLLTKICNMAWEEGRVPKDWEVGVIVPIYKKGDRRDCNNYRGITLLSIASKVYERILETKLSQELEPQLEQSQSGFRKGRSIQDHIFTIKQMMERISNTNYEIYQAFLDLEKAFDRISRSIIEESLFKRKIDIKLTRAIMSMYKNSRNIVRTDNMQSREFPVNEGVRQGGVLSPTLFNLVMDEVIRETRKRTSSLSVGYRNLEPIRISECAFADDLVIFARNENELRSNLRIWNEKLVEKKLKINEEKTKIMVSGKSDRKVNIELNGKAIEQVDNFKYLGVRLDSKGNHEIEINDRIDSAAKVYHSLRNSFLGKREVSLKAKMSIYRAVFVPILTFGCESWVLTKRLKSKIQSIEMKYLRRVLGVTRRDRIRNDTIREQLKVQPVAKWIENCQLRWYGHLKRMEDKRPVKRVWEAKSQKRKNRGRPKTTWNRNIEKIVEDRGLTMVQASTMAKGKKEWKKFIYRERHV